MADEIINKTIHINAPPSLVWSYLTNPELMTQWMQDTDIEVEIITDWQVEKSIIIKGFLHGIAFQNDGKVLKYELEKVLQYNHRSSLSELPDKSENYAIITFQLSTFEDKSKLNLEISNFPTSSIFKHLELYWGSTIEILKNLIENE